jgi:hypothetical protein
MPVREKEENFETGKSCIGDSRLETLDGTVSLSAALPI